MIPEAGQPFSFIGFSFRWVPTFNDSHEPDLNGHWFCELRSNISIRIFLLENNAFRVTISSAEGKYFFCATRRAVENHVFDWIHEFQEEKAEGAA